MEQQTTQIANTYTGKLPCGLEVEVMKLKGYHQGWIMGNKERPMPIPQHKGAQKSMYDIIDILADRIVRIGNKSFTGLDLNEKRKLVEQLPNNDFAKAILFVRFFSTDRHFAERQKEYEAYCAEREKAKAEHIAAGNNENSFEFHEYQTELPAHIFKFKTEIKEGKKTVKEIDCDVELTINDFDETQGEIRNVESYEQLISMCHDREFVLNDGRKIIWNVLDIETQNKYSEQAKKGYDPNRSLSMRHPRVLLRNKDDNGFTPAVYEPERADILDNEDLKVEFRRVEGEIDTRIAVPDPGKEDGSRIYMNILASVPFFFPSAVL